MYLVLPTILSSKELTMTSQGQLSYGIPKVHTFVPEFSHFLRRRLMQGFSNGISLLIYSSKYETHSGIDDGGPDQET